MIVGCFLFAACGDSGGGGSPPNSPSTTVKSGEVGWNLGNTLDALSSGVANETIWGNPLATQTLFDGVKSQGFSITRIPVTWSGHIGAAPNYTVSETRLKRVAQVVDYAYKAGFKQIIINLHHDDSASEGWLKIGDAVASASEKAQITAKFGSLWTQIAEYFKDYDDRLIFESMNEVQDGGWGWSDAFRADPKAQIDIINEWNQLFTTNVRNTGGNNANRYLMYPSYASSPEAILPDGRYEWGAGDVGKYFELPKDTVSGKQIVTFHYYDPMDFAHNGEAVAWDTTAFRNEIDSLFKRFKTAYVDKGIPVIIGEMGPVRSSGKLENGNTMTAAQITTAKENRVKWVSFAYGKAKEYGLTPIVWDNGGYSATNGAMQFGLINRTTGQPNSDESDEVIKAMISATN